MAAIFAFTNVFGLGIANIIFRFARESSALGTIVKEADDIAILEDVESPKGTESEMFRRNRDLNSILYSGSMEWRRP